MSMKRSRSPDSSCDDCLPISKRITRLNIQSTSRYCMKENYLQNETLNPACRDVCNQNNSEMSSSQQHIRNSSCFQGVNNNLDYFPCGSFQCSDVNNVNRPLNGLNAYAVHHGLLSEDLQGYKPDLAPSENPHYYQINSILYRAHLEKASREGLHLKQ